MRWLKLSWFLYAGQKTIGFSTSIEIDLVFVCAPEITWISVSIEIDLFFVWVVGIDLVFVCGPYISWFYCEHRS